jgi:hypothetical protein
MVACIVCAYACTCACHLLDGMPTQRWAPTSVAQWSKSWNCQNFPCCHNHLVRRTGTWW